MQLNRTMRQAGITVTAAALGLLPAAGVAAAHDADSSSSSIGGRVVSVGSGSFVVETAHGETVTVDTTGSTAYTELGNPATLPGVIDGEWVSISLDPASQTPTATAVTVFPQRVDGKVTAVSGSDVTLASRHGARTVLLSANTSYVQKDASPTGVSVGEFVVASGLPDPSDASTLDAQTVLVVTPGSPPPQQPQQQPQPTVTPSTGPPWTAGQPAPPQSKPAQPSEDDAQTPQPQNGSRATGWGNPQSAGDGGGPGAPQSQDPRPGPPAGGGDHGWSGSPGGGSPGGSPGPYGGHSGGGFGH